MVHLRWKIPLLCGFQAGKRSRPVPPWISTIAIEIAKPRPKPAVTQDGTPMLQPLAIAVIGGF